MEEGRNPDRNSGWGMWVVEMEFSSGNVGASRQGRGRCLAEGKERRGSALEICESQLGCLLQACGPSLNTSLVFLSLRIHQMLGNKN